MNAPTLNITASSPVLPDPDAWWQTDEVRAVLAIYASVEKARVDAVRLNLSSSTIAALRHATTHALYLDLEVLRDAAIDAAFHATGASRFHKSMKSWAAIEAHLTSVVDAVEAGL